MNLNLYPAFDVGEISSFSHCTKISIIINTVLEVTRDICMLVPRFL